jgi:hypothetical protein
VGCEMNDDPRQPVGEGQGDLVVEEESLTDFTRRLDDLLAKLGASDGSAQSLGDLGVTTTQAGGSVAEATGLSASYNAVVDRLRTLARIQREAVEALSIATLISERGYDGVETEQVERLRSLMSGWENVYASGPGYVALPAEAVPDDGDTGGGGAGGHLTPL